MRHTDSHSALASKLTTLLGLLVVLLSTGECLAQFDRPWRVYAVPFSHTDVGYTATVPEVIASHERYLDSVVAYVHRTAGNAEGTRFTWTIEAPWVLEYYIRDRSAAQVESLMTLVRSGSVEIGALYLNLQTDLCGEEELVRALYGAQELRQMYGVPVRTAMINDTPGFTWSLAQLLPKGDVPYLSVAMNSFLSDFFKTTTLPYLFFHQAQNGDRVLVWRGIDSLWAYLEGAVSLGAYGTYATFNSKLTSLLQKLAARGYPYDEIFINCATGDNGAPNIAIVDNVQQWNGAHSDAKVVLATASQFFDTVSVKHQGQIPTFSGDGPNWWAWSFSPSASGVFAESRRAQILIPAAEVFSSIAVLWDPAFAYSDASLRGAYVNNLLVEDHNLGAVAPSGNADFWSRKLGWTTAAHDTGSSLIARACQSIAGEVTTMATPAVVVFNPTAWERSAVVTVPLADPSIASLSAFDIIDSRTGTPLPLQRLSDATVVFTARAIPPTGYRSFSVVGRSGSLPVHTSLTGLTLENGFYRVQMEPATGSVKSILDKVIDGEIVSSDFVFNQYRFNGTGTPGPLTVAASDSGPVLQRVTLSGAAPGSSSYRTTVTLPSGEKRIDFQTEFDRLSPTLPSGEDIDFDFNFATTSPALRYEIPFGNLRLFSDELSGFRSKHYAPGRWLYVSLDGASKGVTLAMKESPIIAANTGSFTGSLRLLTQYNGSGTAYRAGVGPQQMMFSATSGIDGFRPDEATRFSHGAIAPFPVVVLPGGHSGSLPDTGYSFLRISPARLLLSTIKKATQGQGTIIRLFNPTGETINAQLTFGASVLAATETSLLEVDRTSVSTGGNMITAEFAPYEVKTLRVVLSPVLDVHDAATRSGGYRLLQNYPNPFNPSTTIAYQLAAESDVTLTVYTTLGQEVSRVVHQRQPMGNYTARFDGSSLASGVYFYRLECSTRSGTSFRRSLAMILLK